MMRIWLCVGNACGGCKYCGVVIPALYPALEMSYLIPSTSILRAHGKNRRNAPMPSPTNESDYLIEDYDGPR